MIQLLLTLTLFTYPPSKRILSWDMFKMKPPAKELRGGFTAQTMTHWELTDSVENGKVYFMFEYGVLEDSSWTTNFYPELLSHEQIHLDITVLIARDFEKIVAKYQGCTEKQKKQLWKLQDKWFLSERRLQALYDKETNHGSNEVMQQKWKDQIFKAL